VYILSYTLKNRSFFRQELFGKNNGRGLQNEIWYLLKGLPLWNHSLCGLTVYLSLELFINCLKFMRLQGSKHTKLSSQIHTNILYSISLFSGIHVLQPVLGSYQKDNKHSPVTTM
jgi:hypothetical protein